MRVNKIYILISLIIFVAIALAAYSGYFYAKRFDNGKESVSEEPPQISNEELQKQLASMIFNEAKLNDKDIISWTLTKDDKSQGLEGLNSTDPNHQSSIIKLFYKAKEQNINYAYLLFQNGLGGAHAEGAFFGAGVFKFINDQWSPVYINKKIEYLGTWGDIGTVNLFPIGSSKIAFSIENSGGGQGYSVAWMDIYFFDGKEFKNILKLEKTGEGNDISLPCGEWNYSSVIQPVPGPDSQFFDIKVLTSGTEEKEPLRPIEGTDYRCGTIVPFSKEATYRWVGDRYQKI